MAVNLDIRPIVFDPFCPHRIVTDHTITDGPFRLTRCVSVRAIVVFGALPVSGGLWLGVSFPLLDTAQLGTTLAVAGIVAAVLLGALPLAQSIAGTIATDKKYEPGEYHRPKELLASLAVLSDLYSCLSLGILVAIASIVPQLLLLVPLGAHWIIAMSVTLYVAGLSVATLMLQSMVDTYVLLQIQVRRCAHEIRDHCQVIGRDPIQAAHDAVKHENHESKI